MGTVISHNDDEARGHKARALTKLFTTTPGGMTMMGEIETYLNTGGNIPVAQYVAACEILQETWTNSFRSPQPGDIREQALMFARQNRADIESTAARLRYKHAFENRMTPESVAKELARLDELPLPGPEGGFERRVHTKTIEGLARILARWRGEDVPARTLPTRKRGEGGLQPIAATLTTEVPF